MMALCSLVTTFAFGIARPATAVAAAWSGAGASWATTLRYSNTSRVDKLSFSVRVASASSKQLPNAGDDLQGLLAAAIAVHQEGDFAPVQMHLHHAVLITDQEYRAGAQLGTQLPDLFDDRRQRNQFHACHVDSPCGAALIRLPC